MARMENGLSERANRFIEEFQIDLNATKAAMRAGYSAKTATQAAHKLMKDKRVKKALKYSRQAWADRHGITKDAILQELAALGFANIDTFIDQQDADGDVTIDLTGATKSEMKALASVEVTTTLHNDGHDKTTETVKKVIKLHDKRQALETIAKHLGMFTDNVQVDVKAAAVAIVFETVPAKGDVKISKDENAD